jgi:hypothetical protein
VAATALQQHTHPHPPPPPPQATTPCPPIPIPPLNHPIAAFPQFSASLADVLSTGDPGSKSVSYINITGEISSDVVNTRSGYRSLVYVGVQASRERPHPPAPAATTT